MEDKITRNYIEDVLSMAFAGGVTAEWLQWVEESPAHCVCDEDTAFSKYVANGGAIRIKPEGESSRVLDREEMEKGIFLYSLYHNKGELPDIMEMDAESADMIVQYALFKCLVYC